jgi:hypothetical protein
VSYPPVKSGHLLIDGATLASVIGKKLSAFSAMQNVDDVFDRRYACGDSDAVSALAHSETFSRLSIFALLLLPARARIVRSHILPLKLLRRGALFVFVRPVGGIIGCHRGCSERRCH